MERVPLDSAAGVAVEVDDAGKIFAGTVVGLIMTALKYEALLVEDLNILAFDFDGVSFENLGAWETDKYLDPGLCIMLGEDELLPSRVARSLQSFCEL